MYINILDFSTFSSPRQKISDKNPMIILFFIIVSTSVSLYFTILPSPLPSERFLHVRLFSTLQHNILIYLLFKLTYLTPLFFSITNYQLLLINIYSLHSVFYDNFIIFPVTHNFSQHISGSNEFTFSISKYI